MNVILERIRVLLMHHASMKMMVTLVFVILASTVMVISVLISMNVLSTAVMHALSMLHVPTLKAVTRVVATLVMKVMD